MSQDADLGLSGPKLMHFSTMGPCGFLLIPKKVSEWPLSSRCSQSMGETNNCRTTYVLLTGAQAVTSPQRRGMCMMGRGSTKEGKIRESQREEMTFEFGLEE